MLAILRRYFLSGLLAWIPILVTLFVINFVIGLITGVYHTVIERLHLTHVLGEINIPGFGILVTLLVIFFTGVLTANFVGKKLVEWWNIFIGKIPLVRSIYQGVKQVLETMFGSKGQAFRKVYLVEYPRKGLWTIAFQTGRGNEVFNSHISQSSVVTLFVPTTPNPTSGFIFLAREEEVIPLDISVDQALKYVISLGVVQG